MKDKLLIEVDCEHRTNVGGCGMVGAMFSFHCLHCPLGIDWIETHIKILKEDTKNWGEEVGEVKDDCGHKT